MKKIIVKKYQIKPDGGAHYTREILKRVEVRVKKAGIIKPGIPVDLRFGGLK
jgi:hypothetical protein